MSTSTCLRRALALPIIGALVTSGTLLGSGSAQAVAPGSIASAGAATISTPAAAPEARASRSLRTKKILRATRVGVRQLGDPYVYGAAGPNSFDCSGLTSYAYKRAGLNIPRTASSQSSFLRERKRKRNVKRGDLVFFHDGGSVYHTAIYLGRRNGNRMILQASTPGTNVQRAAIWTNSWFAGTLRPRRR
ncbi:MAG: C40 family peptidase [Actinomycetota bacterium]|nr:C40 family peptidase [Actinomycetota bacterium]